MCKGKSGHASRITGPPRPSRKIKNLLRDFGDIEHRGDCVWLTLRPEKLPRYLRNLRLAKEACRWVMVLSSAGQVVLCFKRGEYKLLAPLRVSA